MAHEHQSIAIQTMSIADALTIGKKVPRIFCHILQVIYRYKGDEQAMADKNLDG
jgi:hypothetical protein